MKMRPSNRASRVEMPGNRLRDRVPSDEYPPTCAADLAVFGHCHPTLAAFSRGAPLQPTLPRSPSSRPTARTPPFLRLKARCWDGSQAPAGSCQSWGVSSLSGASVAVSLKPKPLHFRLRGAGEGVDWREPSAAVSTRILTTCSKE